MLEKPRKIIAASGSLTVEGKTAQMPSEIKIATLP
jgi:hypothetical protein